MAAANVVNRAKQLESWSIKSADVDVPAPHDLEEGIDSMRAAVGRAAAAYERSVSMVAQKQRECYGQAALPCNKKPEAVNLFYLIDRGRVEEAKAAYQRHRAKLAQRFAKDGAPLGDPVICTGDAQIN